MADILYNRAKYFFEMADYEYCAHEDLVKKDENLRLAIGYTVGQALELTLKQLLEDLTSEFPESHKIAILCDKLNKVLYGPTPCKLPLVAVAKLKRYISEVLTNAKLYGDLAYGAKYIADIKLPLDKLKELIDITQRIIRFYSEVESEL